MCDVPNNAVFCTILSYATSEIVSKCAVRLSRADLSAPITTGTIINFFRLQNFLISICRSLYLAILLAVALTTLYIVLWYRYANHPCCLLCVIPITILVLLNSIILSVRSGVSQYIVTFPFVVMERGAWCNGNLYTLNPLSHRLSSVDMRQYFHFYKGIPFHITYHTH